MKALQFRRNVPRYLAARTASSLVAGRGARFGPLVLRDIDLPRFPADDWVKVRPRLTGICGSDLATIDGRSARYFEPLVSFPFVPGHEIVGDLDDDTRVVVEPVLSCVTRNVVPLCRACEVGQIGNCEMVTFGDLEPGIQTGSCCDTGGGWATGLIAHRSQLHPVADDMSDEAAVMVEPTACAVHGALVAKVADGATVVVIGAGTLGLLTVAALRKYTNPGTIIVTARYPEQMRMAKRLGADTIAASDELPRVVRRSTGSLAIGTGAIERLTGGADVVIDCVGSSASIKSALGIVRPRGRIVLVGMPATIDLELTGLWHREIELVGAYTYGIETLADGSRARTFDLAFDLVREADLGRLVSATYPLSRYTEALEHAANAGVRGAVKVAFDLRDEKERKHL